MATNPLDPVQKTVKERLDLQRLRDTLDHAVHACFNAALENGTVPVLISDIKTFRKVLLEKYKPDKNRHNDASLDYFADLTERYTSGIEGELRKAKKPKPKR